MARMPLLTSLLRFLRQGRTVIVITHNSALAAMADRVIRINSGRVIEETINPNPTPVERIEW